MTFKIYKTTTSYPQKYWWAIVAANGETLASSEMYNNKTDCSHAINVVKGNARDAETIDLT